MDSTLRLHFENINSNDKQVQHTAFIQILEATEYPVDWSYQVWGEMVGNLTHKDNRQRAIAAQVLCNLAKSDPENRMLQDFTALFAVTKDERFVTARHTLQAIWKIGTVGERQKELVMSGLEERFQECISEKNCTLIRYDIVQDLRNLYDHTGDENIKEKALELIAAEQDLKYRKKYVTVWKIK